jgi:putative hemolysin
MTEIAVVSARKVRLRRLAQTGDLKANAALALAESPNRFLATVQVGITLVGVLAGAFGGATIAKEIAGSLQSFPLLARYGERLASGRWCWESLSSRSSSASWCPSESG